MKTIATPVSKPWVKGKSLFLAFFSPILAGLLVLNPFSLSAQVADILHNQSPDVQTDPNRDLLLPTLARCNVGRLDSLRPFFYKNLQYPVVAREKRLQGRVWVSYTIDESGNLVDARVESSRFSVLDTMNRSTPVLIVDGVAPEELKEAVVAMEKEAIRVLDLLEGIQPARLGDKAVKSSYIMPMLFRLSDSGTENSMISSPKPPIPKRPTTPSKPGRIEILD